MKKWLLTILFSAPLVAQPVPPQLPPYTPAATIPTAPAPAKDGGVVPAEGATCIGRIICECGKVKTKVVTKTVTKTDTKWKTKTIYKSCPTQCPSGDSDCLSKCVDEQKEPKVVYKSCPSQCANWDRECLSTCTNEEKVVEKPAEPKSTHTLSIIGGVGPKGVDVDLYGGEYQLRDGNGAVGGGMYQYGHSSGFGLGVGYLTSDTWIVPLSYTLGK